MAKKRPNGDGMIRKRKDGRWEGRIIAGHKKDNTPIYKSVFAKTQKELLPKLHNLIEEYKNVDLSEASRMTLGEWCDKWINEYAEPTLAYSTVNGYRSVINNYIKPSLGKKIISKLKTADIQKLYNSLKRDKRKKGKDKSGTLSDTSLRGVHMLLHEIMDAAAAAHLTVKNPTKGTVVPKKDTAPRKILNEEQLNKFMEAIKNDEKWYDFFYTEITTGLRRGEICGLKWEDLDEENCVLKVERSIKDGPDGKITEGDTKTQTGKRNIVLPPSTLHRLTERHKHSKSEWIFPKFTDPESPIPPYSAYNKLKKILKDAGLPNIRFHDLRHTFATHALASGVDPKTLSGILGHTNASFTLDTYTHVTKEMQKNAADIVGGFIGNLIKEVS